MKPAYTLEQLLCEPMGFGLTTASPIQRALCRLESGVPLGALAADPDVVRAFGGKDAIAALPTRCPDVLCEVMPIRCGKSMRAACSALWATQTCDVSGLTPGEIPRVAIVSLTIDLGRVVFTHLIGALRASPLLKQLVVGEPTADSVIIRHPSGRHIEIKVSAGKRAGSDLVGRWLVQLILDESARMVGSADGAVINLDDQLEAARGRILPGGCIHLISSPWAPTGPMYKWATESFGKPSDELVVVRAEAWRVNPVYWTPERCAQVKRQDPKAYARNVLGEFAADAGAAFDPEDIEAAFIPLADDARAELWSNHVVIDASSGGGDHFTIAVLGWADVYPSVDGTAFDYDPAAPTLDGWGVANATIVPFRHGAPVKNPKPAPRPKRMLIVREVASLGNNLRSRNITSDEIARSIAAVCKRYGVNKVFGDQRESYFLADSLKRLNLRFHECVYSNKSKHDAVDRLDALFRDREIKLPKGHFGPMLRDQLVSFRRGWTKTGQPKFEGKVDDLVDLLITAMHADADGLLRGSQFNAPRTRTDYADTDFQWG